MKINGLPVVGIVVASVVFFSLGYLFYGVLFTDIWMAGNGYTLEMFGEGEQVWMIVGFFATVAQVKGIAFVLKWRGWPDMMSAISMTFTLSICFAAAFATYNLVYGPHHSIALYLVDASHLIVGWVLSAAILTKLR